MTTKKLEGDKEKGIRNIVTFFLQVPSVRDIARHPERYDQAYTLFENQAHQILKKILTSGENPREFFMKTNDVKLKANILAAVKKYTQFVSKAVNELVIDLHGGSSLVDVIERLKGSKEFNNVPGLFWDMVEQGSAKKLGKQYDTRIRDTVLEGYIPVSEDVAEDVWLTIEDLLKWEKILKNIGDMSQYPSSQLREAFVIGITESLQTVIKKPGNAVEVVT